MVLISFPNGADWYKANWVFRQLQKDLAELFPADAALTLEMERAAALGGLALEDMASDRAEHILAALHATVTRILEEDGRDHVQRRFTGDGDGYRMYIEAIAELATILRAPMEAAR